MYVFMIKHAVISLGNPPLPAVAAEAGKVFIELQHVHVVLALAIRTESEL